MEVEKLIEINKKIPRRLVDRLQKDKLVLCHSKGKIVKVAFCGTYLISPIILNDKSRLADPKRNFTASFPLIGKEFFNRDEVNIILGEDFYTASNDEDLVAMLRAVEGGMYGSNAYFLGGSFSSSRIRIPIVYFRINENTRKSLAINPNEKKYKQLIENIRNNQ